MSRALVKATLLFFALLMSGCAGSVKITGTGCQAFGAQYIDINKAFNPQHTWEEKIWTRGGEEKDQVSFTLRELLAKKSLNCKQVKNIRYTVSQNFLDQVFSIIPFRQRMTLKVEVETKS